MQPQDINYLRLQFRNRILRSDGTEFQSFCEDLLERVYPDFKKVKPYGNEGDRGNDGFRESVGIYYQMYAPEEPQAQGAAAARKWKENFASLKQHWDKISQIKEYYFVFNDKERGTVSPLERTAAQLRLENPDIKFDIVLSSNLEKLFLELSTEDIQSLGFDIDQTRAVSIAYQYLNHVRFLLDRENAEYADKALSGTAPIIASLHDERLSLEFELLTCQTFRCLERTAEAWSCCDGLAKRYPKDVRPILKLAELYLERQDFDKHQELLDRAAKIDPSHWLVRAQILIRQLRLGEHCDISQIDERSFPDEARQKADLLRFYAAHAALADQLQDARSFIERAIALNPDRMQNFIVKLDILEVQAGRNASADVEPLHSEFENLLTEIALVEQKAADWGDVRPRIQAILNSKKMICFHYLDKPHELESLAKTSAHLLLKCAFDGQIDYLLAQLLRLLEWPNDDFSHLLGYLSKVPPQAPSLALSKAVAFQYMLKGTLLTDGKTFFTALGLNEIVALIETLEQEKYDESWALIKDDPEFAVTVACAAKQMPELRQMIITSLPDDGKVQKDRLLLLLNYDEDNVEEAFRILQSLDLSKMTYAEAEFVLKIAEARKAWDFVVVILEKLLEDDTDTRRTAHRRLKLVQALFLLDRFADTVRIGESMLGNTDEMANLSSDNREWLLGQTLLARLKRSEYEEAKELLEKHSELVFSSDFRLGIEAEVYLRNKMPQKALDAMIVAVCKFGSPTPEQYAGLFFLTIHIGNLLDLSPTSEKQVAADMFVRFKGKERWYYFGTGCALDATAVPPDDTKYEKFLGRHVGDTVTLEERYGSQGQEYVVETIFPIERYVCWQSAHHAQQLTKEHRWDKMEMIEVPSTGDSIDPKYLIARLEDERQRTQDAFELYCQGKMPLAFLSISQGGLVGALGIITNEQRGFIQCCPNHEATVNLQKAAAKRMAKGETFYLDGTSALVLSETGLLVKVLEFLPGLKVPQTVISFLREIREKFTPIPGQVGFMHYSDGKIGFSRIDEEKAGIIRRNFEDCISALESNRENIVAVSAANKADCFSEQRVYAYLCDACVLAQREGGLILTEDYLYLQANEIETEKKAPDYCSSWTLLRVLCEAGNVTFDQYLEYFAYLTSYRFRFLPLSTDDLARAVFGSSGMSSPRPERLRLFNFSLTLSEEYGVQRDASLRVLLGFLVKIVVDDSVPVDVAKRVFFELLTEYPSERDKRTLGRSLLTACAEIIKQLHQHSPAGKRTEDKFDGLVEFNEAMVGSIIGPH